MQNREYQDLRLLGWTRVDMLLALYHAALKKLEQAELALEENDQTTARRRGLEAFRIVTQLKAGIADQPGDFVENLNKLCDYANQHILRGDINGLNSASRVLATLQDGYAAIHEEAVKLELDGLIPPLDVEQSFDRTA